MKKAKILIILGSSREGRRGESVAQWVTKVLSDRKEVEYELVDLKEWNFPLYNLATSPSSEKGAFENDLQQKWGEKIASADGFMVITPEYNHGYSAVLKNAIDYLWYEWNHKPITFISYGGMSGGIRAVEQLKQVVIELEMIPIRESVSIPHIWSVFDENNNPKDESLKNRLLSVAENLELWTINLMKIRKDLVR